VTYLSTLVDKYPQSKFIDDARKTLALIKPAK
jgi:outer membrane protein assembly factor BamD (BamD/ComL family)